MNKTILKFKNLKKEDVFSIVLSGENSIKYNYTKSLSERRLESGALVSDHSTVEPLTISISGEICDIPTLYADNAGSEIMPNETTLAGHTIETIAEYSPLEFEFSNRYRLAFETLAKRNDITCWLHHPKSLRIVKDMFVKDISISDSPNSTFGFSYDITLKQVVFGNATTNNVTISPQVTAPLPGANTTQPGGSIPPKQLTGSKPVDSAGPIRNSGNTN